jgi:hypothetical protein
VSIAVLELTILWLQGCSSGLQGAAFVQAGGPSIANV